MIVFKCLDRWFRNISEYYKAQSVLDEKGINWECAEEDYDTTTRDGRWKLHIYLMLAQDESDKTSERINYVFEHKIKNKEAITGSQPYGFIVKEIDGHKRVVKDENIKNIIIDIFEHFELYNSKRATLHYIHDKYNTDFDCNDHLYGRCCCHWCVLCKESKQKLGELFPGRSLARPLGHGNERRGIGYERMAPDGSARRGLLVRSGRCGLDGDRSGRWYLSQLAAGFQAPAPL